jgi:hypothetical protein
MNGMTLPALKVERRRISIMHLPIYYDKYLLPKKPLLLLNHMDLMKIVTSFLNKITDVSTAATSRDDALKRINAMLRKFCC